jgi:osmoprotectant transport system ATP-binding protein
MSGIKRKLREYSAGLLSQEYEPRILCAKDAMIKPVFLYPEDSSKSILRKLKREDLNACIVVSKEKKFIGEISDNDIIKLFLQQTKIEPLVKVLNRGYRREFLYKKASDMANPHGHLVSLETPLNKVIQLISKRKVEYVPVLNTKEQVVGVVTPSSIIDLLQKY